MMISASILGWFALAAWGSVFTVNHFRLWAVEDLFLYDPLYSQGAQVLSHHKLKLSEDSCSGLPCKLRYVPPLSIANPRKLEHGFRRVSAGIPYTLH